MAVLTEPEVLASRHAFPEAQRLLAGAAVRRLPGRIAVGWHGTTVDSETGAVAVVREGAGLDDLIGEVIRVSGRHSSVFVYVLGARSVPTDLSLSRRAFGGLAMLAAEARPCVVEVIV